MDWAAGRSSGRDAAATGLAPESVPAPADSPTQHQSKLSVWAAKAVPGRAATIATRLCCPDDSMYSSNRIHSN